MYQKLSVLEFVGVVVHGGDAGAQQSLALGALTTR